MVVTSGEWLEAGTKTGGRTETMIYSDRVKSLFPPLFAVLFSGCAVLFPSPKPPSPIEGSADAGWVSPQLTQQEMKTGGVTLFAILSSGGPEGIRQNAAYEIFQGLRASFPEVRIVPRSDVVEKIDSAGRSSEYHSFVKNYEVRRKIDPDILKQWGEVAGTRYLLIGELRWFDKHAEARLMSGREEMVAGKISVFSSGPSMIPEQVEKKIILHGELWDSLCGRAVWIGTVKNQVVEEEGSESKRVEDLFIQAGRTLAASLSEAIRGNTASGKACS